LDVPGRTSFEWLETGGFLIQRSTVERPEYPNAVSIIGATGSDGAFQQHYFDSRGVARIYDMTLKDNVWTLFGMDLTGPNGSLAASVRTATSSMHAWNGEATLVVPWNTTLTWCTPGSAPELLRSSFDQTLELP